LRCYDSLRRRSLELAIVDYYYLSVRTGRAGSLREYVLDLRFIDRSLGLTKNFPWRCSAVALTLAMAAAFSAWRIGSSTVPWWQHPWLPSCAATFASTVCACLVCAWRMTEATLVLHSVHGRATLLEYTGGRGALRMAPQFTRKLLAHIQLAVAAHRSSELELLRDEMREHHRLKEAGVLSQEQYEASKARILAQHAPARALRSALRENEATAIRPADRGR
jgi:hypothetical protein